MTYRSAWLGFWIGIATAAIVQVQSPDTFTAMAVLNTDTASERSVPVTFVVSRYTSEAEHEAVVNALKEGEESLKALLANAPEVGHIVVNNTTIPLKYAYRRPQNTARLTLVADRPTVFLDPGADRNKSKAGYDFTLAILDFSLPGFGSGEVDPAVKITVNDNGQIATQDFGARVVRLADLRKK